MNSDYQQGRKDMKEVKQNLDEIRAQNQGSVINNNDLWDKTKDVAQDVKDTLVDTAKSAYESTKDYLAQGTNMDIRSLDDIQKEATDVNRNNLEFKEMNQDI